MTRAANEGSIYQRATDGKWVAQITAGYEGGARRYRRAARATQQEAVEALRELIKLQEGGATVANEAVTLADWLREWLEKEAKPGVRPRSYAGYEMVCRKHLIPALGHHKLRKLSARHVRDYLAEKRKTLSPRSVELHHATLRRALVIAERYELVNRNVARLVSPGPARPKGFSPLTPEQAGVFLASIEGHPLGGLFLTAIASGLRMSELLGLRWENADLEKGVLHIVGTLQRYDRAYHLDPPKTALSRRSVPVPPVVVTALKAERAAQRVNRMKAGPAWRGEEWQLVFTLEDGSPRNGTSVTHMFKKALLKAELPPVRFHDLRHGFASYLIAGGVDARTIMEMLGHSQIATTMDVYGHILPGRKRDASEAAMGVLFGKAADEGKGTG